MKPFYRIYNRKTLQLKATLFRFGRRRPLTPEGNRSPRTIILPLE